jgi:dihydrodipicolinate synthase/N-acetylneuraminate lyase
MLLEGLFLPLTTPFYLDGRLNLRKLEHNVDRYSRTPAAGFAVLSDHGDPTLLTDEETREALQSAIELAAPEKVMLAGIARDSVFAAVDLAAFAAGLNYDAVLAGVPSILRGGSGDEYQRRLLTYFQSFADQSPLPLVLASGGGVPVEVIVELAGHGNVLGVVEGDAARIAQIKTATASVQREVVVTPVFAAVTKRMLQERDTRAGSTFVSTEALAGAGTALAAAPPKPALKTRSKVKGFQVLARTAAAMLSGLKAGADGAMPAFGACAPQATYEIFAAWKDSDLPLAEEKQARIQAAAERIEGQLGSAGVRYGCDLNGYFGGRPRLPLLPVNGEERAEIESLMRTIRN